MEIDWEETGMVGRQIAKVAAARKLLALIYHILRDGGTYHDMEKTADLLRRDEIR